MTDGFLIHACYESALDGGMTQWTAWSGALDERDPLKETVSVQMSEAEVTGNPPKVALNIMTWIHLT